MKKAFLLLFGIAATVLFVESGVAGLAGMRFLVLPLLIGGLIVLWNHHLKKPAPVQKALQEGDISTAWTLAESDQEKETIKQWLRHDMALPCEDLRPSIIDLYDNLEALSDVDTDPQTSLMGDFSQDTSRSYGALWSITERLQEVRKQKIRFSPEHERMIEIRERLEGLTQAAQQARIRIAEATLEKGQSLNEELLLATKTLERQTESLSNLSTPELE